MRFITAQQAAFWKTGGGFLFVRSKTVQNSVEKGETMCYNIYVCLPQQRHGTKNGSE